MLQNSKSEMFTSVSFEANGTRGTFYLSKTGKIILDSDVGSFSHHFRSMGEGVDIFKFLANPLFKPDYIAEKLISSVMRAYDGKDVSKSTQSAVEGLAGALLDALRGKK